LILDVVAPSAHAGSDAEKGERRAYSPGCMMHGIAVLQRARCAFGYHIFQLRGETMIFHLPSLSPRIQSLRNRGARPSTKFPSLSMLAITLLSVWSGVGVLAAQQRNPPTGDWKPRIHFYAGPAWNNDPNGPIFLNGHYQLFYQENPYGDTWGHMSWGHAASPDLVHWTKFPVALPEGDGVMNFNGTVVEDLKNTSGFCGELPKGAPACLVAVYTGDSKPNGEERQSQNLAYSRDGGMTWIKYNKNPVLDFGLRDFRDPKVFWHEPSQSWVMVVMLADQHVVQIFRSPDLKRWKAASKFGPAGATGGVWECPDLMDLDVRDSEGHKVGSHWVMSVNLNPGGVAGGSGNQYFLGRFDGTRFVEDHPNSPIRWVDWGKDFYASTSFANVPKDENRLWIAWMSNWQYAGVTPSFPGRGEMTLARRLYLRQGNAQGSADSLVLVQEPVLPASTHLPASGTLTLDQANAKFGGKEPGDSVYALRAIFEPGAAAEIGVRLRRSSLKPDEPAEEETLVGIDRAKGQVFVDRRRSGYVSFSADFPVRTVAPLKHPDAKTIALQIIVDRNSVEVFAEGGETVLTNLIYPSDASRGLAFYATGEAGQGDAPRIRNLSVVPLR
jgi:fructan beta-fructosidase